MQNIVLATLYKFTKLPDCRELRVRLLKHCQTQDLKGTLLLAEEGINGMIAGSREGVDSLLALLRAQDRFSDLEHGESYVSAPPFYRMKVKCKKAIVSMGSAGTNPEQLTAAKVDSKQWNALVLDPEVLILDTRNKYESDLGTFKHSIAAETQTFAEFPEYVDRQLHSLKHKRIATFCTGGIRCEKATSYMLARGFEAVYQLRGGILQYLAEVPAEESLWQGECFVFDNRVAVNKRLAPGSYQQCFACRMPLAKDLLDSAQYQQGISCPYCIATLTEEKYIRLRERQRQVTLAVSRRQRHIGSQPRIMNTLAPD